jgi:CTP:molybdopterin cytidylyltransferase MocA/HD superfamily phosphodiesterase
MDIKTGRLPVSLDQEDISALILAAGFSRRMGDFKPLLNLGGMTVLERIISLYRSAGVKDIRVISGHRSEAIRSALHAQPVSVVPNRDYKSGMFSSVLAGLRSLPPQTRSFFIHPVDMPLVRPHTLMMLRDAFQNTPAPVIYPVFDDRRGHPPLIERKLEEAILAHDGRGGLRALLQRFDSQALEILTADEGILLDMDTTDDHRRLAARLAHSHVLSDIECKVLLEQVHGLAEPVCRHCRQVAKVARAIAEALIKQNVALDLALIASAAMIHDVAKGRSNHALAGAELLDEMGFPDMAPVIAAHMDIEVSAASPIDETQIVHLADKLVDSDTIVNLEQRFAKKQQKYGADATLAATIEKRRHIAVVIQDKIEHLTGETLQRLLAKAGLSVRGRT